MSVGYVSLGLFYGKGTAMKTTGRDLLTHDTCKNGHDITNKETALSLRKRYGKQAGQTYYVCRACENKRVRTYYAIGTSETAELVRIIRANPQLVRPLMRFAKAMLRVK